MCVYLTANIIVNGINLNSFVNTIDEIKDLISYTDVTVQLRIIQKVTNS